MTPNEFKEWRNDMGLTQSQAAKILGFKNRSSICLFEQGKRPITKVLELATMGIHFLNLIKDVHQDRKNRDIYGRRFKILSYEEYQSLGGYFVKWTNKFDEYI